MAITKARIVSCDVEKNSALRDYIFQWLLCIEYIEIDRIAYISLIDNHYKAK